MKLIDLKELKCAQSILINNEVIPLEKIKRVQIKEKSLIELPDDPYVKTVVLVTINAVATAYDHNYDDFELISD